MAHNQSYWFLVREDQANEIFSNDQVTEQEIIHDVIAQEEYVDEEQEAIQVQEEFNTETLDKKSSDAFWVPEKVKLLLSLSAENKYKFFGKDKFAWENIAPMIGTTPEECARRFWNLRRTYMRLLKKNLYKDSKWPYFDLCSKVFNDYKPGPKVIKEHWGEGKVKQLLNLYIESFDRIHRKECLQKDVWNEIGAILGSTALNCYNKYKNLKKIYEKLQTKDTSKLSTWIFYPYFDKICTLDVKSDQWDEAKIRLLISSYSALAYKFKDPTVQKQNVWDEIAPMVGESPGDCDRKFRNLKQTYLRIKMNNSRDSKKRWKFYQLMDQVYYKSNCEFYTQECGDKDYIKELLEFCVENRQYFLNPLTKKMKLWRSISSRIKVPPMQCDKKFRNLKSTYIRLEQKRKLTGKQIKWPYYSYFEKIFGKLEMKKEAECPPVHEIKKVVEDLQDNREDSIYTRLVTSIEESNDIQRERNRILQALLNNR